MVVIIHVSADIYTVHVYAHVSYIIMSGINQNILMCV